MLRVSAVVLGLVSATIAQAQQIENCGSYSRNGPILSAICIGNYGVPQQTSIDLRSCPMYAIRNQSGSMVCSGGGGYGGYDDGYDGGYRGRRGPPGYGYGGPRYGY